MHAHIRVPPDSTGKRVHARAFVDIQYSNLTNVLYKGDVVTFGTSGILGRLSEWTPATGTTGQMYVTITAGSAETELVNGEAVTTSANVPATFTLVSGTKFYDSASILTGRTVDSWLEIDKLGALSTRFAEGAPHMSGFGDLKVSESNVIGVYDFTTDQADDLFSDSMIGAGALTYVGEASMVTLSVGTASGDFAGRTSNKYHFYWPGVSNLLMMTVSLSDNSHIGCERRWGLFDDNNGVYFDLDDTGELQTALRSTSSGTLVKTHFLRVNWNTDKLDGLGVSGLNIDVTKVNIYWIDYQWLGGGRVRFGVISSDGSRIVCHSVENANNFIRPYMAQGSLPLRVNIENKALTSGAASINMICAVVRTEGPVSDYTYWRYGYPHGSVSVTGDNIPLIALKAKAQWGGKHNITTSYPETYSCYVGGTGAVRVDLYWDLMVYTGATWAADNGSTVVADMAATATTITTQDIMKSFYLDVGVHEINLREMFEVTDVALNSNADESEPLYIALVATKLAGSPTVEGTFNYRELR